MLCENPFVQNGAAFRCGSCPTCLINTRRTWSHRIQMETNLRTDNCFANLTYEDSNLPLVVSSTGATLPDLRPKDLQDWLKRLRAAISPLRIRFYAVGEYGDESWRPHYHVALFGFPTCLRGRTRRLPQSKNRPIWRGCCVQCELVGNTWGKGDVDLGTVDIGSAQYLAQYVTKKMTHRDNSLLLGRHPEFARMSLRPGIGHDFMHEVASSFLQYETAFQAASADVPSALRVGSRSQPIGRYLRRTLRKLVGRDVNAPKEALQENEEMQALRVLAFETSQPLKSVIINRYAQKILSTKAKAKIRKQGKSL